ncbi:hypothetical protein tinsulaeT_10830 [Thalassotalea insulae]|uniref:Aminotransferase class I/classII large domain-containing protein n=1 Tax=Thalassotalea insulae TaxID=2056778 RepID=A0ABQ6GP17_9GAMM|nr:aminotransferase class I/II-fold pyridoxal phosphate-dependent enzyme [Thalassotalea insulae]GLX77743.1 hypothetical protein tinsulaeT_10830 [Thalassotalea insulae]
MYALESEKKSIDSKNSDIANRKANVMALLAKQKNTSKVVKAPPSQQINARAFDIRDFDNYPEVKQFNQVKALLNKCGVENPYFRINEKVAGNVTQISGTQYINYSSYNYLGLSGLEEVQIKAKEAIDIYGTSPSASRLAAGEKPIHGELEQKIANFIGTEAALVCAGGHSTNVTVIGHMFNSNDLIIYDDLSHNSVVEGCILSGARRIAFPHNDTEKCEQIIKENINNYQKIVIIIEGAYSMDGDLAPLDKFVRLRKKYPVLLYVDEAHSLGTVGKTGRGIGEYYGINAQEVDFWMGTLSKALASNGGYIAGRKSLINYLKYTTPGFVYAAGITPANAAAAVASLDVIERSNERVQRLQKNTQLFIQKAKQSGFNTGPSCDTPIVPIIVGDSEKAIILADKLFKKGVSVHPMFYPSVPLGEARLRFFISSEHTVEDLDTTIRVLSESI